MKLCHLESRFQCRDSPHWVNVDPRWNFTRQGGNLGCVAYERRGYCLDGKILPGSEWTGGMAYNHPERHCCACGAQPEATTAAASRASPDPLSVSRAGPIYAPDVQIRSNNGSVAVCMSGQLRTFLEPEVQIGYSERLHRDGYEYFLSTDQYISFQDPRLRVKLQSIYVSESAPLPRTECPPYTTNHRFNLPMATRLSHCYTLIQAEESKRAIRYSFVLRARPDLAFPQRVPPLDQVFAASATEGAKLALADDLLGLAAREDAATLFLVPSIAYSLCAGDVEWSHACKRPVVIKRLQHDVPCCPMNLITFFGASRTWQPLHGSLGGTVRLWRGSPNASGGNSVLT